MTNHPAADLFPMLDADRLAELSADIKANGLRLAVVTYRGMVLDGRNRLAACALAGVAPTFTEYAGTDPVGYVVSANLQRRDLNDGQRGMIATELATMRQGQRTDLASNEAKSQTQAAAEVNVSRATVQRAAAVKRADPALAEQVKAGTVTLADATRQVAHVSHNSGDNEWYTPVEYIRAAVATMGEIDLDPASHPDANAKVEAHRFYTADDDGLAHEWAGRVWMNPPYSQPLVGQFADKLVTEFTAGRVTAACVLVNNATETAWFQALLGAAAAVCFPRGRVRFWAPGKVSAPLQGQTVLYLGTEPQRFAEAFGAFGIVLYR